MEWRSAARRGLILGLLLLGAGCGPDEPPAAVSAARPAAAQGVEIRGRLAAVPEEASLLAFAYSGAEDPLRAVPASVSAVGPDGWFVLGGLPAGALQIVFLLDTAADGALDPGDPMARLADPEGYLRAALPGDRIMFEGIRLDLDAHRAVPESSSLERVTPAPTPTVAGAGTAG